MIGKRSKFNIGKYTLKDLKTMVEAGMEVNECRRFLTRATDNIIRDLLPKEQTIYQFNLGTLSEDIGYEGPPQLYCQALRASKHGHFHIFLQDKDTPRGRPSVRPFSGKNPEKYNDKICHLFAISIDRYGFPIRLFTTNLWVTGENWYKSGDAFTKVERLQFNYAKPSLMVARWVTAMLRLFLPQVTELLEERDAALAKWTRKPAGKDIFGDWELYFPSIKEISFDQQNDALLKEVNRRLGIRNMNAQVGKEKSTGRITLRTDKHQQKQKVLGQV